MAQHLLDRGGYSTIDEHYGAIPLTAQYATEQRKRFDLV
jgi:hypothetical protein